MRTLKPFALCALFGLSAFAQLTLYPGPATIEIKTTRQMSAYVPLTPNTVTWFVNGVIGGDAAHGMVTQAGLFTAPQSVPPDNLITVKIVSTAYPNQSYSSQLTITQPAVNLWSVSPSTFATGPANLSLNGSNFVPGASVSIGGTPVQTTYVSPASLKVITTIPANMLGKLPLLVSNPGPGATTSLPVTVNIVAPTVTVSVGPANPSVAVTGTQQFSATVVGNANTAVNWSASAGTITSAGLYTAPAVLPNPATATIRATSVASPLSFGAATVTLTKPLVTVGVAPSSAAVQVKATQQFAATVTNAQNPAVTWQVNGVTGGNATVGSISATGLYAAPAMLPSPAQVTVRAVSVEAPTVSASAVVSIKIPTPAMPNLTNARFLDQAAYGPTAAELQNVGQLGLSGWVNQQFAMAETPIPMAADNNAAAQQFLSRIVHAPDQLRQRVTNALAKIIVISTNKNNYSNEIIPYWQILSRNAFGNYRQLLSDITVSPQMGKYLDLANSAKAGLAGGTNENYAREVMQLFTVGLVKLNQDGTKQLDGQNQPIPTYDQAVVQQMAKALTGWTYPTAPGAMPGFNNWENFSAPSMEVREQNHDISPKTIINGCQIPGGMGVAAETNLVLDCLFNHPNTAPFIVTRLIRDLVTSNPSPAYVQRVVDVWNNNGMGAKGDLKAVVTAILLDQEARQDQATPAQGRLKDAQYAIASFVRAMNGSLAPVNIQPWSFTLMGMSPLSPPSVFGFYSLLYQIPGKGLAGPEFQIYSPTESVLRGNYIYSMITNPNQTDLKIDLTPFQAVAADSNALIEQVNATLLYGRMPQSMKTSLATALAAAYDNNQRVQAALYLTTLSGYYTVQY